MIKATWGTPPQIGDAWPIPLGNQVGKVAKVYDFGTLDVECARYTYRVSGMSWGLIIKEK